MLIPIHTLKQMLSDLPSPDNVHSETLRMRVPIETKISSNTGKNTVPVNHTLTFTKELTVRDGMVFKHWALDMSTTLS